MVCSVHAPGLRASQASLRTAVAKTLQVASQLSPEDKEKAESAINEAISWLDANQLGEVRHARNLNLCFVHSATGQTGCCKSKHAVALVPTVLHHVSTAHCTTTLQPQNCNQRVL